MNMNKLQLMSINILNSKYRVLFTLGIYFIVYSLFYTDSVAFCMRSGNIPAIAESKDEIIRNLQKQVNDLTADREFLHKTVQDMMKDSFEVKQQHLNELRKAQEEVFDLRFRNVITRQTVTPIIVPQAEPVLETENVADLLLPLQNEVKAALRENNRLTIELKKISEDKRELENLLEQKEIQIKTLSELVERKSTEVGRLLKKNHEIYTSRIRASKPVSENKETLVWPGDLSLQTKPTTMEDPSNNLKSALKYFRKAPTENENI